MKTSANEKIRRRAFLKGAAVAATTLGAAATHAPANATTEDAESVGPAEPKGYRETEHIREYYRAARF